MNKELNNKSYGLFKHFYKMSKNSWYMDNKLAMITPITYYHGLYEHDELDHLYLELASYKTTMPFKKCRMQRNIEKSIEEIEEDIEL